MRLLCGAFSAVIFIFTIIGIGRGRITYTIGHSNGGIVSVALTTPQQIAAGALCWGIVAIVLFTIAAKPSYFQRTPVLIIGVLALASALVGLDYLA